MTRLRDRPTADLIVIWLALIVGISLLIAESFIFILAIGRPEISVAEVTGFVSDTTNVIIGAVVGYIAGRVIPTTAKSNKEQGGLSQQ